MVQIISNVAEWEEAMGKAGQIYIVDFFADWCGPCKMIAPKFKAFSEQYKTIIFLKVNVDEVEDVAVQAGISAMPTFQIWKDGAKVEEMVGAATEKLEALIKKYAEAA